MSSAAADSPSAAPAGANPSSVDSARLEQPNDAVAMKSMPERLSSQEPEPNKPTGDNGRDEAGKPISADNKDASEPAGTNSGNTQDGQGGDAAVAAAPSKDKEDAAPQPPLKERQDSIMAIGPAQDEIRAVAAGSEDTGPVCNITLLLTSGSRHPYRINAKYLTRRNVPIPEQTESGQPDPFSISVYTLKELILREWRNDWETKPASPSSIRLIHFGKLLDDKEALKKYQFIPDSPNVVHMSIRPQDLDEEEPKSGAKNPSHGGGDGQRQRSGGCCVVL